MASNKILKKSIISESEAREIHKNMLDSMKPYLGKDGKPYCPRCHSELKYPSSPIPQFQVIGGDFYCSGGCGYHINESLVPKK